MKAFQKFIFITISLFLVVGTYNLSVGSPFFNQFTLDVYGFLAFTKFVIPVLAYMFIFERLMVNSEINLTNPILFIKLFFISFALVFVISMILIFSVLYFGARNIEYLSIFNPTSSPSYFMVIVVAFDLHKKMTPIPILRLNEKPIFYLKLFFFSILGVCVFLLIIFALATLLFHHKLEVTSIQFITDCFLYAIMSVILAFFTSFGLNKIIIFRKSVIFSMAFSTAITFWAIKLLGYPQGYFRILISENILLIITFFLCLVFVNMPIGRSKRTLKINKLTSDFSKKEAEYLQLKNQINPHFLFNNLNVLISFIELDTKKAVDFGIHLSNVYRHYLKSKRKILFLCKENWIL